MIDPDSMEQLAKAMDGCVASDGHLLDELRTEVRALRTQVRRIQPRSATAISLVGTDGGNNQLRFDPFLVQLIRVVDSSQNEYCLEVITPNTPIEELEARHLDAQVQGKTPMGRMMNYLGVTNLKALSGVFDPQDRKPSWINVYREMAEWAILFSLLREKEFATDTVIVCDGFLRSKMFSGSLFGKLREGMEQAIRDHFERNRRRIYVAGIAKHSSVIQIYRMALALEGVMKTTYPCYLDVPREMEQRAYKWDEYIERADKFVAGKMFLVKFGAGPYDPIWAIDLFLGQRESAPTVLGYLLEDSKDGFPIPLYPQCLQRAHESAALVDFDLQILEDQICQSLRRRLGDKKWVVDELSLQEADPANARYA
jgi:hypothetical protein